MKKLIFSVALMCAVAVGLSAQNFTSVDQMPEARLPFSPDASWGQVADVHFEWGSLDVRYEKMQVPAVKPVKSMNQVAWRGERVCFQSVLWTPMELHDVVISVSDLSFRKNVIKSSNIKYGFER